jgi:hypothetical protein
MEVQGGRIGVLYARKLGAREVFEYRRLARRHVRPSEARGNQQE